MEKGRKVPFSHAKINKLYSYIFYLQIYMFVFFFFFFHLNLCYRIKTVSFPGKLMLKWKTNPKARIWQLG